MKNKNNGKFNLAKFLIWVGIILFVLQMLAFIVRTSNPITAGASDLPVCVEVYIPSVMNDYDVNATATIPPLPNATATVPPVPTDPSQAVPCVTKTPTP